MEEEQQFCLRWNNFQANITSQFEALRDEEDFVDVTLACDGQRIKAHKVVLSACSPYFKELFRSNPCKHPILFMRDVEFQHLQSLVEFMYAGEVNVAQAHLSSFLRTAESLQIRGLTEAPQQHKQGLLTNPLSTTPSVMKKLVKKHRRTSSPTETSRVNTSSPEAEDDDDDDDDNASRSSSTSPPPAKRPKDQEEKITPSVPVPSVSQPPTSDVAPESDPNFKEDSLEIFEPKLEAPDYNSDGESKGGGFFSLDNSIDNAFSALHGSLDMFAGPSSQGFTADSSHEAAQAYHQKLHSLDPRPCPICNRMYSNLSNLRQHVRLIHNPQTVACPLCSKPFKTKLYLKRHLMSFHELQCTNPATKPGGGAPPQPPNDFFPPPPQVFLGALSANAGAADEKPHNSLKMKDYNPEYFHSHFNNLSNDGERPFSSHGGNAQELPSFPSQPAKEDEGRPISDKSGVKHRDGSLVNSSQVNSDYRTTFLPQQLGHSQLASNDAMAAFANIANDKTPQFHSTPSLNKNTNVADFLDSDSLVHSHESPKNHKESEHSLNN